jgi:hypothetical protein
VNHRTLKLSILGLILLWGQTIVPSILSGTLIKTPHGLTTVENVTIGNHLTGYNNTQAIDVSITNISTSTTTNIIKITTNNGDISAAPDQLFYDPVATRWIPAKEISTSTLLLDSNNNHCACLNIKTISVPSTDVYHISTTYPHTFFISEQELLTHNIAPVAAGLVWAFGGGLEFVSAAISTAIFGSAIGIHLYKKQANAGQFTPSIQSGGTCGGYNPDPDDDENKERIFNTISKSEFFKSVKKEYEYWQDGIYKRKHRAKGIEDAEYLEWDHLHNDVEAYSKGKDHIGSIDPKTLKLYKKAVYTRTVSK